MKLAIAAIIVTTASAFSSMPQQQGARLSTALNGNIGLYYSSSTGNTETVAGYIAEAAGLRADDIGDAKDADITGHDAIIIGAPTWHTGEDSERSGTSWDSWLVRGTGTFQLRLHLR